MMIKRTLISLFILASLSACNDDNNSSTPLPPEIKTPEILIVGHRGASALRPEHTLEAYQKAIDDGADFIEPDLVPTKDGYLVARHENEIGGTSNVSTLPQFSDREKTKSIDGISIKGWFTEDFTLAELNEIKARERIPKIRPQNTQYDDLYNIPTLEQIIELVEAHYKKTGKIVGLYIETKHPSYFSQPSINLAMEDKLLSTLSKYSYTREIAPVYLQSFEVKNLKYLREQLALHKSIQHAKIIQLFDNKNNLPADGSGQTYGEMATAEGLKNVAVYADGVGPSKTYIVPNTQPAKPTSFVKDAHAVGLKVHPYTLRPENDFLPNYLDCNTQVEQRCESGALQEYEIFFKAGVDGIFTDDPGLGRKALNQYLSTLPRT